MSPKVPTSRPRCLAPKPWAVSSITARPCSAATWPIAVMSAARPKMWTGMIAFVFGVTRSAILEGSRQYVSGSMSANTGVAPMRAIASAVA